jgi:hypothetical protein
LNVFTAALLTGALAGCASASSTAGGDPGNAKLHLLAADPVMHLVPPGATGQGGLILAPARYRAPGFDGGGWDGPAVTRHFDSTAGPQSVFEFYAHEAAALGWRPTASRNALGFPQVWTKIVPRATAHLSLTDLDLRTGAPGSTSSYVLNASA